MQQTLFWTDISSAAKNQYYKFIIEQQKNILSGTISADTLCEQVPVVSVELTFIPEKTKCMI